LLAAPAQVPYDFRFAAEGTKAERQDGEKHRLVDRIAEVFEEARVEILVRDMRIPDR
jgi:hypothetical protein